MSFTLCLVRIVFSYLYYLLEQNGILANPNYNMSVVIIQLTMDALLLPLNLKIRIQSKHSRKNHCSITVTVLVSILNFFGGSPKSYWLLYVDISDVGSPLSVALQSLTPRQFVGDIYMLLKLKS